MGRSPIRLGVGHPPVKSDASPHVGRLHRETALEIPGATALFWVTSVLTTGRGETASDYLAHRYNLGVPYAASTAFYIVVLITVFFGWWRIAVCIPES